MKLEKINRSMQHSDNERIMGSREFFDKSEQKQFYKEELESLKNGKSVENMSSLSNFMPFIDKNNLIKLGGRLEFSDLSVEGKNPIIQPKHSRSTILIIHQEHEKTMHEEIANTLAKIRSCF